MELINGANLAVRFLLELCALAALGYWGLETGRGPIANIGLGIGTPLVAVAIWATLVAPGAAAPVPGALRLLLELTIFGLAVAALYSGGRPALAWSLGLTYVINRALMYAGGQ